MENLSKEIEELNGNLQLFVISIMLSSSSLTFSSVSSATSVIE